MIIYYGNYACAFKCCLARKYLFFEHIFRPKIKSLFRINFTGTASKPQVQLNTIIERRLLNIVFDIYLMIKYRVSNIILDYLQALTPKCVHNARNIWYFLQENIYVIHFLMIIFFNFLISPFNLNLEL